MIKKTILTTVVALTIAGCGGGGGGNGGGEVGGTGSGYSPQATNWSHAIANAATSYKNFKKIGLTPQTLPAFGDARGYGDFTGGGPYDLFIASLNYLGQPTPADAANFPATFAFYANNPQGSFVPAAISIHGDTPCIHPRKALVADFNGDGKPDIFVACHGFDSGDFPGEKNKLLLSQTDGSYLITTPSNEVGYFHSATAADVNGDGLPDVLVVNFKDSKYRIHWLLNQGGGTFVSSYDGLPQGLTSSNLRSEYFTVELVDVDGDGLPDLFLSGFNSHGATGTTSGSSPVVYINPGNFDFSKASPIFLPPPTHDFVTDVVAGTGTGGRTLWLSVTDAMFSSASMQTILWPSLSASDTVHGGGVFIPDGWIRWIIPVDSSGMIESDTTSQNPMLPM